MHTAPHDIPVHKHHTALHCTMLQHHAMLHTAHRTPAHAHTNTRTRVSPLSSAIQREGSGVSQLLTVVLIGIAPRWSPRGSQPTPVRLGPRWDITGTRGGLFYFYTAHIPRWSTGFDGHRVRERGSRLKKEALPGKTRTLHYTSKQRLLPEIVGQQVRVSRTRQGARNFQIGRGAQSSREGRGGASRSR